MSDRLEMWVVRPVVGGAEIWSENGRQIARFNYLEDAQEAVDDHNLDVELNRPPTAEEQASVKASQAEKLAQWRAFDPTGASLLSGLVDGAVRLQRFCAMKAPNVIIHSQVETLASRLETVKAMFPCDAEAEDHG